MKRKFRIKDNEDECIALNKQIDEIREQLAKKQDELGEAIFALKQHCQHTKVSVKESYTPGGYLNTGYITTWHQCDICGSVGPKESKSDGRYG